MQNWRMQRSPRSRALGTIGAVVMAMAVSGFAITSRADGLEIPASENAVPADNTPVAATQPGVASPDADSTAHSESHSARDQLYTGQQPGSTYDMGRSFAVAGGSLAILAFTGAGIVLYIAMQSDVRITPEFLLWTTGIAGGVIVLGGLIAGVGGLLALSDRSHERPRDGMRLLGLGIGPTGVHGGLSAGATFSF